MAEEPAGYVDIGVEQTPIDAPPSSSRSDSSDTQLIFTNDPERTLATAAEGRVYPDNSIRTTKYRWYNFLAKNLFEQFRRIANFYFLIIAGLQLTPGLSNVTWLSSVVPLVFVLGVTALKEAYEDVKRARTDAEINNRIAKVVIPGSAPAEWEEKPWRAVQVGDILRLEQDDEIPADVVVLGSSLPSGLAYLETANLDGETNLKIHQAPKEVLPHSTDMAISSAEITIQCELPNNRLYVFDGALRIGDKREQVSLSNKNILLRGCKLRNTKHVYAAVVFTGSDTKLVQNSTSPPSKRSTMEVHMNSGLMNIFAFMFTLCAVCAIMSQVNVGHAHYYIHGEDGDDADDIPDLASQYFQGDFVGFLFNFGSFVVLFSVMVPISLYVSVEIAKFVQAYLLESDETMYYEPLDLPARAKTTNLTEELGQVQYIFSDKTGTLTCNVMEFNKCCIGASSYNVRLESGDGTDLGRAEMQQALEARGSGKSRRSTKSASSVLGQKLHEFWTLLAVCHTVLPDEDSINAEGLPTKWQAESPDELALVEAAAEAGYIFVGRKTNLVTVHHKATGERVEYRILNFNEFNSTRKRMSVVVEMPDGTTKLMVKGADSVIAERLTSDAAHGFARETAPALDRYALVGLRTLLCAERELTDEMYEAWNAKHHDASIALKDRSELLAAAAEEIEQELDVVGGTAIEDKLQDGVPEAIASLIRARIKVWVLTGDKVETAVNIALSCNLLRRDMNIVRCVKAPTRDATLELLMAAQAKQAEEASKPSDRMRDTGLVLDGKTLEFILDDDELRHLLVQIGLQCASVVCCRVSPLQKSLVVRCVRDILDARTLAIGDGANDVSMIQAAHVGVGISGREGMQAVMASDYAIGQFRYLQTLLLVHGRYNYKRISFLVLYSFYKNMTFIFTQFWFTLLNLYSAANLFSSWHLTVFNVLFTGFPILAYAILEQDVPRKYVEMIPQLYETGLHEHEYSNLVLWRWLGYGLYSATVIYFGSMFAFDDSVITPDGRSHGVWSLGTIALVTVVLTVNIRLALASHHLNRYLVGFLVLSVGFIFIFSEFLSLQLSLFEPADYYGVFEMVAASAPMWLGCLLLSALCLLPDIAYMYLSRTYLPQNYQIVQEMAKLNVTLTEEELETVSEQYGDQRPVALRVRTAVDRLRGGGRAKKKPVSGYAYSSRGGGVDSLRALGFYKPQAKHTRGKKKKRRVTSLPAPELR